MDIKTGATPLRGGAASAQRTRDLILKAAIDEFAEHGLAGGRVDRIAKRAGVNKQALYYHYGDKERLFQAALAFGYSRFELREIDWKNDPRPPVELMQHIIGAYFDLVQRNRNHMALIVDENRSGGRHLDSHVVRLIRTSTAAAREAIVAVLERGKQSGCFSMTADPETVYLAIAALPMFYFDHRFTLSAILKEDVLSNRRVASNRRKFIRFILDAIESRIESRNSIQPTG